MQPVVKDTSDEEKYFLCWAEEAKEAGLVRRIKYQPKPFTLCEPVKIVSHTGAKGKEHRFHLLNEHIYTADFLLEWEPLATEIGMVRSLLNSTSKGKAYFNCNQRKDGLLYSVIDTKGSYSENVNDIRFPLNQKWVYAKYGIYVQKVVPFGNGAVDSCMFTKLWTPRAYAFRPMAKIKGKFLKNQCIVRTLKDYLNEERRDEKKE